MTIRARQAHPVYAGGPPCNPYCPGDWSEYHDGYRDGWERAEREVRDERKIDGRSFHRCADCGEVGQYAAISDDTTPQSETQDGERPGDEPTDALRELVAAVGCVPYHRHPRGGPCGYPDEGHREYTCPVCIALNRAEAIVGQQPPAGFVDGLPFTGPQLPPIETDTPTPDDRDREEGVCVIENHDHGDGSLCAIGYLDRDLHIHDWGDATYTTIKRGKATCVDPECPDDRDRRNQRAIATLRRFRDEGDPEDHRATLEAIQPDDRDREVERIDVDRLARAIDAAWRRDDRNPHAFGESLADEGRLLARAIAVEWPDA